MDRTQISAAELARRRESRRNPRRTQFDYLHLRRLADDLAIALGEIPGPVTDVVDVFCGARPYDDLMPSGAHLVGYDIDDHYGVADVTGDFLPFDDASFDLATCIEGFQFVPDPQHGVAELRRVLRPGGTVLITVPLLWEYTREVLEYRFTEMGLRRLFEGWEDVRVVENGGRVVAWALLTGILTEVAQGAMPRPLGAITAPCFAAIRALTNVAAERLDHIETRLLAEAPGRMPMNLMLLARRPAD
jgi:SAM-dependent methyltransferase